MTWIPGVVAAKFSTNASLRRDVGERAEADALRSNIPKAGNLHMSRHRTSAGRGSARVPQPGVPQHPRDPAAYAAARPGVSARILGRHESRIDFRSGLGFWRPPATTESGSSMSRRVLMISREPVGPSMAGPGIRYFQLAKQLGRDLDVTLLAPEGSSSEEESFTLRTGDASDARAVLELAQRCDVVVSQELPVEAMRRLARSPVRTVYDLYVPSMSEGLAYLAGASTTGQLAEQRLELARQSYEIALACGDAFICASERQRDFLLGELTGVGRVNLRAYKRDPDFRHLIDVVPFGVEDDPFSGTPGGLRGKLAGVGDDDKLVLWGGGIWNWFDPLTAIRAIEQIAESRDDIKLYFMGLRHPAGHDDLMAVSRQAIAYANDRKLTDKFVFFNFGWTPYADRIAVLADSAIGISCHQEGIETRFAFRTRLLDYFWAGLPTVCTRGDVLSELVERRGAGIAIAPGNVADCADAIVALVNDCEARTSARSQATALGREHSWSRVAEPLLRLCTDSSPVKPPGVGLLAVGQYQARTIYDAAQRDGLASTATRVWRRATS